MKSAIGISKRLCSFIDTYAKIKNMPIEECALKCFGVRKSDFEEMRQGKSMPSLQVCDIAINRGCHPRFLYLGDQNIPGDPVKCFSLRMGNKCRFLDVDECEGYTNCHFYKPERVYLAELDRSSI